jgi:hypothetical protein
VKIGIPYVPSNLAEDMPVNFYEIDFDRTFDGACLLCVEAVMQRSDRNDLTSPIKQACDEAGVPIWMVGLAALRISKDYRRYEAIDITLTSPDKPCGAVPIGTEVTVEGLEIGFMVHELGIVAQIYEHCDEVYFTAKDIRPLQRMQSGKPD